MKKYLVVFLFLVGCFSFLNAQTKFTASVGEADPSKIGKDEGALELQSVTISDCEEAAFWVAKMPLDEGVIMLRTLVGNPKDKETKDAVRLAQERKIRGDEKWTGENVIGVKVNFFRRGANTFSVMPVRPIPVPGATKMLSIWVVGRNYNHELKMIIEDFYGNKAELSLGKLNFSGWRKLTVAVPPSIVQSDLHYTSKEGIRFLGLKIECAMDEAFGTYYFYFDDISAETDLFSLKIRDEDDMDDGW